MRACVCAWLAVFYEMNQWQGKNKGQVIFILVQEVSLVSRNMNFGSLQGQGPYLMWPFNSVPQCLIQGLTRRRFSGQVCYMNYGLKSIIISNIF